LRVIRTFILRLLVNSAEPQALRGDLRPLPEGEAQPFPDEQALLALLRRLTGETAEPSGKGTDETSSEHRFPAGGEP
jgi:hypothetical protein